MPPRTKQIVWVVEDNAHCSAREVIAGVTPRTKPAIKLALHRVSKGQPVVVRSLTYKPGSIPKNGKEGGRAHLALDLIKKAKVRQGVVISGPSYGSRSGFVGAVRHLGLDFVVQVRSSTTAELRKTPAARPASGQISNLLRSASWKNVTMRQPRQKNGLCYSIADFGRAILEGKDTARLFAVANGGIRNAPNAVDYYATSLSRASIRQLVRCTSWLKLVRLAN